MGLFIVVDYDVDTNSNGLTMHRDKGFTLVELMIALGLMAVLTAMALPSFDRLVRSNVADKFRDDLYSDLVLARSEALSRGRPVVICSTTDPTVDSPDCNGDGDDWVNGWILFEDVDRDGDYTDGTDDYVAIYEQAPVGEVELSYNRDVPIAFDRLGRVGTSNGTFSVCRHDVGYARGITLGGTGRARHVDGSAAGVSC